MSGGRPSWLLPGCPAPPAWRLDWGALLEAWPLVASLGTCAQDPTFHREGSVLEHTRRVVGALVEEPAWRALPATDRSALMAAALLHDAGKPACTKPAGPGRLTAAGHAGRSALLAGAALYRSAAAPSLELRRRIVGLVRHHGLPLGWARRKDAERATVLASLACPLDQLALLARADARGRSCDDGADLLDSVDLFAEHASELGCLEGPWPFGSGLARFLYARGAPSLRREVHDESAFEVVVLSGLPGAGKDTWLGAHAGGRPVVSLDALRDELEISPARGGQGAVVDAARRAARAHLRRGEPFVWNATNVSRRLREGVIGLATDYGARVRLVYLEAPWAELRSRNERRPRPLPAPVLERLVDRLEVPLAEEAPAVEWLG